MVLTNETKDRNINIRASGRQMSLIDQAAALKHTSRSDFMLEAATRMAEEAIFEGNIFTMPSEEWDAYIASIESPPAPSEALRTLLREPAPWE